MAFFFYSSEPPSPSTAPPQPPPPAPVLHIVRQPLKSLPLLKSHADRYVPPPRVPPSEAAKAHPGRLSFDEMAAQWALETEDADLTQNFVTYVGSVFDQARAAMVAVDSVQCRQTLC